MRRFLKFFVILCVIAFGLFVAYSFLFPVLFGFKEPYFAMPLKLGDSISASEGLPIRYDDHGDGYFGAKRKGDRKHAGLDLDADLGTPVYASKSGWTEVSYIPRGYGNLVKINHPGGWQTRYSHLDRVTVGKWQWVWKGGLVGFVGKTGNANVAGMKPHLHFEIRYKDEPLDPAPYLAGEKKSATGVACGK